MNVIKTVLSDLKAFYNVATKPGRKHALITVGIIILATVVVHFIRSSAPAAEPESSLPEVSVLSVSELASEAHFDTIGKVEAVSQANLQTETGGRITSVSVKVGDKVSAGQVIATLDNKLQRASLTQAQGSYEAAVAASAVGDVSVSQAATGLDAAKDGAVSTYKNAFTSVNGAFNNTIDSFFSLSNPNIIGLKIDGFGYTTTLNNERTAFKTILPTWQQKSAAINTNSDLESELTFAGKQVDRTIAMVDSFISIFNQPGPIGGYNDAQLKGYSASFTALRGSLIATRTSIDAAQANLKGAKDNVKKAQLAATGGQVSVADAQVKIALGALQAAQASYEKTLVRTPISGVVNALYLKSGDYAAPNQPAAIIANNNGLQVKTFVNQADSAILKEGDPVTLEGNVAGVITAKADALDPSNGKVAIIVGVNEGAQLTNGATVKVTFSQLAASSTSDKILIPLSALKITSDGSFVFSVNDDGTLKATKIEQGQLLGDNVEILSGITKESRIVTDARGLKDGQRVTIKK